METADFRRLPVQRYRTANDQATTAYYFTLLMGQADAGGGNDYGFWRQDGLGLAVGLAKAAETIVESKVAKCVKRGATQNDASGQSSYVLCLAAGTGFRKTQRRR
jgi:hypothetical protein